MSVKRKSISLQRFSETEKNELMAYLCRDCKPEKSADRLSDPPVDDNQDCGEPLEEVQYVSFMTRLIELLNRDDAGSYRIARFDMRRLWENESLPKCQMSTMCHYVQLSIELDRFPKKEKTYSSFLSDTRAQLDEVIKEYERMIGLLQQEETFAEKEFHLSRYNDELIAIVGLARGCLKAAMEIRNARRADFSVLRRKHDLFALRKLACHIMKNPFHKTQKVAKIMEISHIIPILHEAISGKTPTASQYHVEHLRAEAKSIHEESTKNRLRDIESKIEMMSPGSLDIHNESWRDTPKAPKELILSTESALLCTLSYIFQSNVKSQPGE